MLMKKVIVSVLSLLCAMFSIGSVSACDFNNSTVISESFCQGGAWIFFILFTQILSLLLPE